MEQKFSNNSIDLQVLREFCEREGEAVSYRKGDQMEREGFSLNIATFSAQLRIIYGIFRIFAA